MKTFWNERYAAEEYAYGVEPNMFFKNWIDGRSPGTILFPGEGEGRNAVYAARLGWEVYAFDYSEAGQKKALALAQKQGVVIHYEVVDAESFSTDRTFDAIVLIYAHFPPPVRSALHPRLADMLKQGGLLVLEGYNKQQLKNNTGGPQHESLLFDEVMLRMDFERLEVLSLENATLHVEEGLYHQGISDVIRFVAKK